MKRSLVTALWSLVLVPACTTHHGMVHEVEEQGDATVRLSGTDHVAPGDPVTVFQSQCETLGPGHASGENPCKNVEVGHGTVVKLVDSKTAVVRPDQGTQLEPGMFVQKDKAAH